MSCYSYDPCHTDLLHIAPNSPYVVYLLSVAEILGIHAVGVAITLGVMSGMGKRWSKLSDLGQAMVFGWSVVPVVYVAWRLVFHAGRGIGWVVVSWRDLLFEPVPRAKVRRVKPSPRWWR